MSQSTRTTTAETQLTPLAQVEPGARSAKQRQPTPNQVSPRYAPQYAESGGLTPLSLHLLMADSDGDDSPTRKSTGSALLDSFVRERASEPHALKTLRLVPTEIVPFFKNNPRAATVRVPTVTRFPVDTRTEVHTTETVVEETATEETALEEAAFEEAVIEETIIGETVVEHTVIEGPATAVTLELTPIDVPGEPDLNEASPSDAQSEPLEVPDIDEPSDPDDELPGIDPADQLPSDDSDLWATPEHPELPDSTDSQTSSSEPQQIHRSFNSVTPKAFLASRPRKSQPHLAKSRGQVARDSAAEVGLLDLNDTLLFGGDHENIACVDPLLSKGSAALHLGVLGYLSEQVTAFTVDRLQHNLPITTHLAVLLREDPPVRETVLGLSDFRLSDSSEGIPEDIEATDSQPHLERDELSGEVNELTALSKQVQVLNKKIESLTRQLSQKAV